MNRQNSEKNQGFYYYINKTNKKWQDNLCQNLCGKAMYLREEI